MTSTSDRDFFRVLWGSRIMPKWKLFIWKLWHNGLATKRNLYRCKIGDSSECPICLHDIEDTYHLFLSCPLALEAWAHHNFGMNQNTGNDLSLRDWIRYWLLFFYKADGYQGGQQTGFVGTLWTIWLLRNDQVFRQWRPTTASIHMNLQQSDEQHATFIVERNEQSRMLRDPTTPPGFHLAHLGNQQSGERPLKMQIRAAWDKCNLLTGIGWVISSSPNQHPREYGCFSYASSAIAVVLTACLKAVTWARTAGYTNIIILTSSAQLLQILQSSDYQDINIKWTIDAIRTNDFSFNSCQVIRVCSSQIT
ncbi:uncharacterized protein LOC104906813 [Beta vulgaris subsp. vulgaris]|uniref:uncharacterized protein LOC104906813 n=1 Tax=Beta vulgaris subsp. vulgaris TaxID=3555 RepID=UPI00053FB3BE|nr:uncharacterized protein LOC104906813 [Beta vulgaris subsp. vulgaris]